MTTAEEAAQKKIKPLSARQKEILDYIINEVTMRGYPPAVREIGEAVSLRSSSTVHAHLHRLEKLGYIHRDPAKPRAIMVLRNSDGTPFNLADDSELEPTLPPSVELPLVGKVSEGDHAFSYENIECKLAFSTQLVQDSDSFVLKLCDNSMMKAGLLDGDYIIVTPQQEAQNGDIVVVLIGNEVTCKTFYYEKNMVRLQPENDEMEPTYVENPMIIGKVIGVYRDLQKTTSNKKSVDE